jgi:glycine/D-amino acid oxidase-like deaminating enzyme
MPFARTARPSALAALRDARPVPLWLDHPSRPAAAPPLEGLHTADLAVVGGGFTGLWTALLAKEADPARDVVLVEAGRIGHAASGRNGGFCSASLTHGLANGVDRFEGELPELIRLGHENLDALTATVHRYGIECDLERTGDLVVATDPHHVPELEHLLDLATRYGEKSRLLDRDAVRELVDSPRYLAGLSTDDETVLVDPARLAWGLAAACREVGVRIFEGTTVDAIEREGSGRAGLRLRTAGGAVTAPRVALGTNAFPPLLRRLRHYVVPVYDYVIATAPLPAEVRASLRWADRQGVSDAGNQFHYYRLTRDDRIVFGGYDAIYHRGNSFGARHEQRRETFELLAEHLVETFPQVEGVPISHTWGGAIDTCSRFSPFWGTAFGGRLAYVAGYTGLGVGASRFGAATVLDLLAGARTERTGLEMVRSKPMPFPPEPVRGVGIDLTRASLDRADRNGGRRNLWLRTLDRIGLGFDS